MRERTWLSIATVAICLLAVLPMKTRAGNDRKELDEALQAKYQLAQTSYDGSRVIKEGTPLVLQQDGVYANPTSSGGIGLVTNVKDGHIAAPGRFMGSFVSGSSNRSLKAGTVVYARHIDVSSKDIRFDLVTADQEDLTVHGNTQQVRYMATLRFEFASGDLDSADPASVEKTIETVLLPQSDVAAANTKTVSLGQSEDQVKSALGAPDKIINLGAKVIYVYKDIKVVFTDGKVVDVQ